MIEIKLSNRDDEDDKDGGDVSVLLMPLLKCLLPRSAFHSTKIEDMFYYSSLLPLAKPEKKKLPSVTMFSDPGHLLTSLTPPSMTSLTPMRLFRTPTVCFKRKFRDACEQIVERLGLGHA